jgi:hypothetical protein
VDEARACDLRSGGRGCQAWIGPQMWHFASSISVMAGLDPAIHVFVSRERKQDVDHRVKPGDDELMEPCITSLARVWLGASNCSPLDSISAFAADLPVVPIGRRPSRLIAAPNHRQTPPHPVPTRGAFRDRHGRWAQDAVDAYGAQDELAESGRRSRVVLISRR